MISRTQAVIVISFGAMLVITFHDFNQTRNELLRIEKNQSEFRKTYETIQKTLDDRSRRFDRIEKFLGVPRG